MEKTKIEETKEYIYNLYKAKNTLWYFNKLLENNFQGYTAVKFKNNENVFVWLEDVKIQKDFYAGKISDTGVNEEVYIDNVIDWMIINNERMIGGYTIRHYRDTLDDHDKQNFDIDFGIRIDDGNDFFHADFDTPEGVIIKLENYYTINNLEGILSCKNFLMEAKNVLNEKGIPLNNKLIQETAELLKLSLIENLKADGFPTFKDVERVFTRSDERHNQQLIEEKLIYKDKTTTVNKFWVGYNQELGWKVLNLLA